MATDSCQIKYMFLPPNCVNVAMQMKNWIFLVYNLKCKPPFKHIMKKFWSSGTYSLKTWLNCAQIMWPENRLFWLSIWPGTHLVQVCLKHRLVGKIVYFLPLLKRYWDALYVPWGGFPQVSLRSTRTDTMISSNK